MYNLVFSDLAKKQFNKLEKNIQERIGTVLERIKIRPHAFVEKLVGEPGYKLRVGDYRIFIDIFKKSRKPGITPRSHTGDLNSSCRSSRYKSVLLLHLFLMSNYFHSG